MGAGVVSRKSGGRSSGGDPLVRCPLHHMGGAGNGQKGYPEVGGGGLIDTLMLAGDSPPRQSGQQSPEPAFTTAAGSFRKVWQLTEQIS